MAFIVSKLQFSVDGMIGIVKILNNVSLLEMIPFPGSHIVRVAILSIEMIKMINILINLFCKEFYGGHVIGIYTKLWIKYHI
jgi:hypothetical protein